MLRQDLFGTGLRYFSDDMAEGEMKRKLLHPLVETVDDNGHSLPRSEGFQMVLKLTDDEELLYIGWPDFAVT